MIKTDLITGFLGSGKTTFIKKYAGYMLQKGFKVGILENDHGAVNVDVMLLEELEKAGCIIETIAGACDKDCHMRRFKTKLIALAMSGCDRVIIEPSGIFDIDEFFDSLREEPLDRWYETGSVITIVDGALEETLSPQSRYLLASQCVCAGSVLISRTQLLTTEQTKNTTDNLKDAVRELDCTVDESRIIAKSWDDLTDNDMEAISRSGYVKASFVKKFGNISGYSSLYFMNKQLSRGQALDIAERVFTDRDCGNVFRVKGFICENGLWYQLNAARDIYSAAPIENGQDIIIVIGENLNKSKISGYFGEEK